MKFIKKITGTFTFWIIMCLLLFICSLLTGAVQLNLSALAEHGKDWTILLHLRFPRALAALIGGAGLAISGLMIQSILNNPLASASTLGIQSGAGFMICLAGGLFPYAAGLALPASFAGSLICAFFILFAARKVRFSRMSIILSGLAVSSFFSAGIDMLITAFPDSLSSYGSFKTGSLNGVTFQSILPGILCILVIAAAAVICSRQLEILSMGVETADLLGMNAGRWSGILLFMACILSASVTSFGGLISFIGLMVPHLTNALFSGSMKRKIPAAALQGASLLLISDILARILLEPFELPAGVLLSFAGGPYMIWLLIGMKKRNTH